jgi:hypothetical protein
MNINQSPTPSEVSGLHHIDQPNILIIDRPSLFVPDAFLGKGWSILQQDKGSLVLTAIDLLQVAFNKTITSARIQLDAGIFWELWENQDRIPDDWMKPSGNGNTRYICFGGTLLRNPDGVRCVLCLFWNGSEWRWSSDRSEYDWLPGRVFAVLKSECSGL